MTHQDVLNPNPEYAALGFGLMRLPSTGETTKMVDMYMEAGFNYFDTAYVYGGSEEKLKKTLSSRFPRDSFLVADKLPPWTAHNTKACDRLLNESLNRCGLDHIDFYLIHSLDEGNEHSAVKNGIYEWIVQQKAKGLCRHIGFSFHDSIDVFKEIIDDYDWDMCLIQLNYLDTEHQAGLEGYEYATKNGIPVTIMGPVRGGQLAKIPAPVRNKFKDSTLTNVEIALRYVADLENNKVILSGMGTMEELKENIEIFSKELTGALTEEEKKEYVDARNEYYNYKLISCNACDYCKDGCPKKIPISEIFTQYNASIESPSWSYRGWYSKLKANGSACTKCGNCEAACPQHLDIADKLDAVHKHFTD